MRAPSDRPLRERLVGLAGRADDNSHIAGDLVEIARLSADRITAVSYASVTSRYEGAYATVAASSDLAVAVDQAQYADEAGPCLDALDADRPVAVPEVAATMAWPGFREIAGRLGLRSSLSIPLFAGRGTPIAALNLYGHEPNAMKILTAAVCSVYETDTSPDRHVADLDAGGDEMVTGLAGAFATRATIQQALGILMSTAGQGFDQAYTMLRLRAAETGATMADEAGRLLTAHRG
jgi:hypothetical protein